MCLATWYNSIRECLIPWLDTVTPLYTSTSVLLQLIQFKVLPLYKTWDKQWSNFTHSFYSRCTVCYWLQLHSHNYQAPLAKSHKINYSVPLFLVSSLHPLLRAQNETNNIIHIPTSLPDQSSWSQLVMRSTCHEVNLSWGQLVTKSTCHEVNLSRGQLVMRSTCHEVNLSWSQLVMKSTCHEVNLSWGQLVIRSTCHEVNLSWSQLLMSSTCHEVNLSWGQLVMRSALAKSVCHEIHFTPHHMNFNVSDPILVPSVHQYSCFAWQRTPELVDGTNTQKSPKIGLSQTVILHIFVRFRVSVVLYSTSYRDEC